MLPVRINTQVFASVRARVSVTVRVRAGIDNSLASLNLSVWPALTITQYVNPHIIITVYHIT